MYTGVPIAIERRAFLPDIPLPKPATPSQDLYITMAQPSIITEKPHHPLNVNTANEYHTGQNEEADTLNENSELPGQNDESGLPPVDQGKQAWLFLAACYVIEAVTFGVVPQCPSLYVFLSKSLPRLGCRQGSAFRSASCRTTIAPTSHLRAPAVSPPSEQPRQ